MESGQLLLTISGGARCSGRDMAAIVVRNSGISFFFFLFFLSMQNYTYVFRV
jgi:hypothetical protein